MVSGVFLFSVIYVGAWLQTSKILRYDSCNIFSSHFLPKQEIWYVKGGTDRSAKGALESHIRYKQRKMKKQEKDEQTTDDHTYDEGSSGGKVDTPKFGMYDREYYFYLAWLSLLQSSKKCMHRSDGLLTNKHISKETCVTMLKAGLYSYSNYSAG